MSLRDFAGHELAGPPAYGARSVADVFESAASLLAQQSLNPQPHPLWGAGRHDPLKLAELVEKAGYDASSYRSVCVIMVDGLGQHLLEQHAAYAPFLAKVPSLAVLDAPLPSTTAASLTSFGTALPPGTHAVAGYEVKNPDSGRIMNHLSGWDKSIDPRQWQPFSTVFERYEKCCDVATISLSKYQGSGLSEAALRGGRFIHAQSLVARTTLASSILSARKPSLVYLYWGEIDQAGHRFGVDSPQWREHLEELNLILRRFVHGLPSHVLVLLTADHGMVDIKPQDRIDYSGQQHLLDNVSLTAGEPRLVQLHLADRSEPAKAKLLQAWSQAYGDRAWILDSEQLYQQGYFGGHITEQARARIGHIMVACREDIALYDMRHYKEHALAMVGQHGSWTDRERLVPLLLLPTG